MVAIPDVQHAGHPGAGEDVVKLCKARGIPVLVDGSQAAVYRSPTVTSKVISCLTGHKIYGPSGIGVLWGKYDPLAMPPFNGGGRSATCSGPRHLWRAAAPLGGGTPPIVQATAPAQRSSTSIRSAWRIRAHEAAVPLTPTAARDQFDQVFGATKDKGRSSFEMKGAHARRRDHHRPRRRRCAPAPCDALLTRTA